MTQSKLPETIEDSFIKSLEQAALHYRLDLPLWRLYGDTGIGARLTLAMDVNRGKDIGHPSSNYTWDIIAVAENCFDQLGMYWELLVGKSYASSARHTAAQSSRTIPDNVVLLEGDAGQVQGPLIHVRDHHWNFEAENLEIVDDESLPFGPVVLRVLGFEPRELAFPRKMLKYLIKTIERGEEPMEIVGRGNYSAVSGWKAYARWMQAFSVPLPGVRHTYLDQIAKITYERRTFFSHYLMQISKLEIDADLQEMMQTLSQRYSEVLGPLQDIIEHGDNLERVKNAYFTEQKTQSTYKRLAQYLKNS